MNPKDVAKMKIVSLGTVYLLKNSTSFDDKPRTGRPKKYSDKDFIYYIEKYPYFSPHQRRDIWKKDGNSEAPSVSTIE
jgi:transposase